MFASMDSPQSPSKRGTRLFKYRITDQMRQKFRAQLFNVTRSQLVAVADKYLKGPNRICVLGTAQHQADVAQFESFECVPVEQLSEKLKT
jgi:Zn-dependent M16 (insulinase) family peptidase